jgi:hypothetical protein
LDRYFSTAREDLTLTTGESLAGVGGGGVKKPATAAAANDDDERGTGAAAAVDGAAEGRGAKLFNT